MRHLNPYRKNISSLNLKSILLLLGFTLVHGFNAATLAQQVSLTTYDTSNSGLPSNMVKSIAIDNKGTKWIGTEDAGLAKYDGNSWTTYDTTVVSGLS